MENLSDLLTALAEVYEEHGNMKTVIRSGRNQRGEALHRFKRAVVLTLERGPVLVFEAVDEPDLEGRR